VAHMSEEDSSGSKAIALSTIFLKALTSIRLCELKQGLVGD
jgi:hypothetical protein